MNNPFQRPWPISTYLLVAFLALIGSVGGYFGVKSIANSSCGQGVEIRGNECTGVTDGSHSFATALNNVFARIKQENHRIAHESHATIALMIPMTSDNAAEQTQIREEVQGAYLAQYRANHLSNSQTPAIRLVLANPGRGYVHWRPVADELARMADSPADNLRAVTGFDISLAPTKKAIAYLTGTKAIPVVAGPITADDIANSAEHPRAFPGLARVAPTNSDEAAALHHFTKNVPPAQTLVVEDTRTDDNYISTLRQTFEDLAKGAPQEPEGYNTAPGDVNAEGTTANQFHQIVTNICVSRASVIYFAGRPVQLRQFINALGNRTCPQNKYTVISGSHASTVAVDKKFDWSSLQRGVTVEYASLAHPEMWTGRDKNGGSEDAYHQLSDLAAQAGTGSVGQIGPISLTDSRTIITYDSVWTAVTAIRSTIQMPTLKDVADEWSRLHGALKVEGASGWICLDNYGNAYDKAVPVVRLEPNHTVKFVDLAWPTGKPPGTDCTAPNKG